MVSVGAQKVISTLKDGNQSSERKDAINISILLNDVNLEEIQKSGEKKLFNTDEDEINESMNVPDDKIKKVLVYRGPHSHVKIDI
jgi:hypothetical protein